MGWAHGLAAVVLIAIALLAVPVDFRCRADTRADDKWSFQARWLLGLVRIERPSARRRKKPARREPAEAGRARAGGMPKLLRSTSFLRRAWALMRTLLRRLQIRRFDVHLTVGLDDPADTGCLMGALLPVCQWVRPHLPGPLAVVPDFEGEALELRGEAEVRLVPLRWIGPLTTFGVWTAWQALRARRGPRR